MRGENIKQTLEQFIHEVWDEGDTEAVARYLAPLYTIHHDPGDPWERQVLDLDGYITRLRLSRAPFRHPASMCGGRRRKHDLALERHAPRGYPGLRGDRRGHPDVRRNHVLLHTWATGHRSLADY
jgi:hypothetical protein